MIYSGGSRISPRGHQLPGGRQHTILPKFPKNCMKLKEFGPRGGGGVPCANPFRSATGIYLILHFHTFSFSISVIQMKSVIRSPQFPAAQLSDLLSFLPLSYQISLVSCGLAIRSQCPAVQLSDLLSFLPLSYQISSVSCRSVIRSPQFPLV